MANENDNGSNVTDLTLVILKEMRDDLRGVKEEAQKTNARLDQHGVVLQQVAIVLEQHGVGIRGLLVEAKAMNTRLDHVVADILHDEHLAMRKETADLRDRVDRLEKRTG